MNDDAKVFHAYRKLGSGVFFGLFIILLWFARCYRIFQVIPLDMAFRIFFSFSISIVSYQYRVTSVRENTCFLSEVDAFNFSEHIYYIVYSNNVPMYNSSEIVLRAHK